MVNAPAIHQQDAYLVLQINVLLVLVPYTKHSFYLSVKNSASHLQKESSPYSLFLGYPLMH